MTTNSPVRLNGILFPSDPGPIEAPYMADHVHHRKGGTNFLRLRVSSFTLPDREKIKFPMDYYMGYFEASYLDKHFRYLQDIDLLHDIDPRGSWNHAWGAGDNYGNLFIAGLNKNDALKACLLFTQKRIDGVYRATADYKLNPTNVTVRNVFSLLRRN